MEKKLRPYQYDTIKNLGENLKRNIQRNLIVLATGLGKTYVATEIHKEFNPEKKTLFLVDRIELAYQAHEAFEESDSGLSVGIEMNTNHASDSDDVVIACVDTIGRRGSKRIGKFSPDDFNKVIVDEAHGSVADKFIRVLNYLGVGPDNLLKDKILIGLTATPNRTDNVSLGYVYDDICANFDLVYAIRHGWLTEIEPIKIQTNISLKGKHFTDHTVQKLTELDDPHRNKLILRAYEKYSKGENALIYCHSVDNAYTIAELFNEHGIPSATIEAHTPREERKENIKKYKNGEILVLTNFGTLTTGFNAPETTTIILGRPIKSDLLLRQIIGRGLRTSETAKIDFFEDISARKFSISTSDKPSCKLIDIYDEYDDDRVVGINSLFGISPKMLDTPQTQTFFKDVVEPLLEAQEQHGVDLDKIDTFEDLEFLVSRSKSSFESVEIPEDIDKHTKRPWLKVTDNKFQITYADDKCSLLIEKNALDKWTLIEINNKKGYAKELNTFQHLSSAVKLGDEYADNFYDTEWADRDLDMREEGVSSGQRNFLKQLYKGGVRIAWNEKYPDNNEPVVYFRNTGNERLNAASASRLIRERIG